MLPQQPVLPQSMAINSRQYCYSYVAPVTVKLCENKDLDSHIHLVLAYIGPVNEEPEVTVALLPLRSLS